MSRCLDCTNYEVNTVEIRMSFFRYTINKLYPNIHLLYPQGHRELKPIPAGIGHVITMITEVQLL